MTGLNDSDNGQAIGVEGLGVGMREDMLRGRLRERDTSLSHNTTLFFPRGIKFTRTWKTITF